MHMDANIINSFLEAAINVLKIMAVIEPKSSKPFLKRDVADIGDISGITGAAKGSMFIFTAMSLKH